MLGILPLKQQVPKRSFSMTKTFTTYKQMVHDTDQGIIVFWATTQKEAIKLAKKHTNYAEKTHLRPAQY